MKFLSQSTMLLLCFLRFAAVASFNCTHPPVNFQKMMRIHECCPIPELVNRAVALACKQPPPPLRYNESDYDPDANADNDYDYGPPHRFLSERRTKRFNFKGIFPPRPAKNYMACFWTCVLDKSGVIQSNVFYPRALRALLTQRIKLDRGLIPVVERSFRRCWNLRLMLASELGLSTPNANATCPSTVINYIMDCLAKTVFANCTRMTWRGVEIPLCEEKRKYVRECHITVYRALEYKKLLGIGVPANTTTSMPTTEESIIDTEVEEYEDEWVTDSSEV